MIDYDVIVLFDDDTTEIIPVAALSPVRALTTALYTVERWGRDKQFRVAGLSVQRPARRVPMPQPVPRPVRPQLRARAKEGR